MTLQEFLDKLAETPREWRLRKNRLRCMKGCPIDALGGDWGYQNGDLGLAHGTCLRIIIAADNRGAPKTRAKLLKACGL